MLLRLPSHLWKMCSRIPGKSFSDETSQQSASCIKASTTSVNEMYKFSKRKKTKVNPIEQYENATKTKAIGTLNTIQMPSKFGDQTKQQPHVPVTQADKFDAIRDLPVDDLDKLSAIHVAGTKGKGSVCAFCESILRNCGYKTGFYSSPHLLEVRERMRINGKPISKELFTQYFWHCWDNFEMEKKRYYTRFLVFMAFRVFLREKVDVAVVEVGCGGEYDTTNIIRHPVVCGVTLLDKDHLDFLGGTVESIAWHKAGIFKSGAPAFTIRQEPASMKILGDRAKERGISLKVVPHLPANEDGSFLSLGIEGEHQLQNASLAVHLCHTWIERRLKEAHQVKVRDTEVNSIPRLDDKLPYYADEFPLPESFKKGLANAFWPGRTHCIEKNSFTLYLDGAHTRKSIEACTQWFCKKSREEQLRKSHKTMAKVLVFNLKGHRNAKSLVEPLVKCGFDCVVFCPNLLNDEPLSTTSDISNFTQDIEENRRKCYINEDIWKEVFLEYMSFKAASPSTAEPNTRVFSCVLDAFNWIVGDQNASNIEDRSFRDSISRVDHVQIFVTGSLHLVGIVLKLIEVDNLNEMVSQCTQMI